MLTCNCNRVHELNESHFKLIEKKEEIHFKCIDCDWQIIVGANFNPEGPSFDIYTKEVASDEDTIGKITSASKGKRLMPPQMAYVVKLFQEWKEGISELSEEEYETVIVAVLEHYDESKHEEVRKMMKLWHTENK